MWFPVARWQGERTIGRLPEPVVTDSFGQVGAGDEQLSLVVLGDELAAAAGFAETIASRLAEARGARVVFQSVAESMATIRDVHYGTLNRVPARTDAVVLVVGAHDVLARTGLDEWRTELAATLQILRRVGCVVVAQVPDLGAAPLVGWPLSSSLTGRVRALNRVTAEVCGGANPGAQTSEPRAQTNDPRVQRNDPRAQSNVPRAQTNDPRACRGVPLPAPTGYEDDRWTPDATSRTTWAELLGESAFAQKLIARADGRG
ncbi:hypothetical protein [Luteococcus sanguinis]|uniref:SGNH hydrolase-type esterase domain-containing protein n=1 Tax=Luteococcus sanguinis TaxID=174038 RepID=A0ABW1X3F7_9ACTN